MQIMNTMIAPILLNENNFPSIIHNYFPVTSQEDMYVLFHVFEENIDRYLKGRQASYESWKKYITYKSSDKKIPENDMIEKTLTFYSDDLHLVPYSALERDGTFKIEYNKYITKSDIDLLIKNMNNKLENKQNDETIINKIINKLNNLEENYFSYELKNKYLELIREYIISCRFTNLSCYFTMARPIFVNQEEIYRIFNMNRYILISGGTGIGKTAVIPLLYYHYLKSQLPARDDYSITICEPRISTTKNPYKFLRLNTGSDFKYTFNNIQEILERKYNIKNFIKTYPSDYIERVYNGFPYIQMIYRSHNYIVKNRFKNTKITFMTDGIFYARLIFNPSSVFKQSLIVIDEVHENSLNSLIGLAILMSYIDEDRETGKNKLDHIRVMLITALCQPYEKRIFSTLLPDLYEYDKLPSVTKYRVTEVARPQDKLEQCVSKSMNGLVFVPNEMAIDSYIKELSHKFRSLLCVKLTRDTNINIYNGDVTSYLKTYAINKKIKYLVIATNVAESSITFPDLDYVIDLGKQLNVNYDISTRISKIENEYMTLNSKVQRMGRVGRTRDGTYIRLYEQSSLIEYKNKIKSENLSQRLIDIICNIKSDTLRIRIIDKIKKSFDAEDIIEKYIKEFNNLNLLDNTVYMYRPSSELQNIYKLKVRLKTEYKNKSDPSFSKLFSTDDDDDDDNNNDDDKEEDDDKNSTKIEISDIEFKLASLLYYCNIEQVRKFIILIYEDKLIQLLSSDEYKKYINNSMPAIESDIIILFRYLESYQMNDKIKHFNDALTSILPEIKSVSLLEDIDIKIFKAISKSLHFNITNTPIRSQFSRVRKFESAFVLELNTTCTLVHSRSYIRDYNLIRY